MGRVGYHPMKTSEIIEMSVPKKITITTLVHIPELVGFWENSLEVLKLSLSSLFAHTDQEFDLMVFDNGSCKDVYDYLSEEYQNGNIQYLFFSEKNLRKTDALPIIFREAPGEIICYFDSDVYFLPNWLDESLKVLEKFPKIGMLTACPVARNKTSFMFKSTYEGVSKLDKVEKKVGNNLIDDKYVVSHALSVGVGISDYKKNRLNEREDFLITCDGISAFITAVDFQYITTKKAIDSIKDEWNDLQMNLIKSKVKYLRGAQIGPPTFQILTDKNGFWKLSTKDYLVHHMGNRLPDLSVELPWVDLTKLKILPNQKQKNIIKRRSKNIILRSTRLRRIVKKIHLWTYKFLYES